MLLSDRDIKRRLEGWPTTGTAFSQKLVIDPLDISLVQPASLDIRLGSEFWVYKASTPLHVDPFDDNHDAFQKIMVETGQFFLDARQFALGVSLEYMEIPDDIAARIEGRSSLGRLGLLVHSCAGFIDPGFKGKLTLELKNISPRGFILTPGMRIGQLCFFQMSSAALKPYVGRYQGQTGAVPSRYHEGEQDRRVKEQEERFDNAPGGYNARPNPS